MDLWLLTSLFTFSAITRDLRREGKIGFTRCVLNLIIDEMFSSVSIILKAKMASKPVKFLRGKSC